MRFSTRELFDIAKAWFAISLAFAIALGGFSLSEELVVAFVFAALTVGVGFVFHELAHKFVAQYYKHYAEFRSFDFMLLLAVIMSLGGFIFAAPGAVMIDNHIDRVENGKISAAGIVASLIAALFFFLVGLASSGVIAQVAQYGVVINSWLALFNLIPIPPFDGSKVFAWNKLVYVGLALVGVVLFVVQV